MGLAIYHVDAFTDRPFAGNPAGVCPLPLPAFPKTGWMQAMAAEMNLAATAFLVRRGGGSELDLRWFTRAVELELCGHATLASAARAMGDRRGGGGGADPLSHPLRRAERHATRRMDRAGLSGRASALPEPPSRLAEILGAAPVWVGANRFGLVTELADEGAVRGLAPDLRRLAALPYHGLLVTARAAAPGFDMVSRYFAPALGIDEDSVTGSAHCCLGPYWGERLGKSSLLGYQASPRGGVVRVELAGDRVHLGGQAVTVFRGELAAAAAAAAAAVPAEALAG